MKIIIVGAGEVGYNIAKELCKENEVFIIEKDEKMLNQASQLDVKVIHGNGANAAILENTDIKKSELLVAVTGTDEVNIVSCLVSKILNKNIKTIARVSNPDYIDKPVHIHEKIGINIMICPELSLASEIHRILSIPEAIDVEEFANGRVRMTEYKVGESNSLIGKKLSEISLPKGCIMSAIFRGSELKIPHGNDIIEKNDRVVFVGKLDALDKVKKIFVKNEKNKNRIAIIGGGKIGYYLAVLLSKKNNKIVLIEKEKEKSKELAIKLPNVLVLNGDGTDLNLMKEENIGDMDALIAVTDSDEKNLLCSLLAKKLGTKKVISKTDRTAHAELFEMVGIDIALSPIQATVYEVLKFTMGKDIKSLVNIEGEKGKFIEFVAHKGTKILNKKLKNIDFPKNAIISAIVRNDEVIIPDGNSEVLSDDKVIIFTLTSALSNVDKLFK